MALRFFLQIILFQKRHQHKLNEEKTQEKWERLLQNQATEFRETALRLEGLLIKVGQFLSARADIMPPIFLKELEELVDQVPAVPWEQAKEVLETEWDQYYGEIVHKISAQPVASASIGEVYHAYLHNGESVAIKIQRPGIERLIRIDFKAIKMVIWFARHFTSYGKKMDLLKLYKEMTIVIGQELNYKKELQNGLYFQKRYERFNNVMVPNYYTQYSTKKVLVMEWIEGAKITDLSFLEKHNIDRNELASRLLKVFLEQLLQQGKFQADPHPGNLMMKSDGTIVLIDFGMIGDIKKDDAIAIQALVEGIIFEDYDIVIEALQKLKFLLPHANKDKLKEVLASMVNIYLEQDFTQLNDIMVQQILEDVQVVIRNEPIQLPSDLAFFGRAISIFVGVLYTLDPKINLVEISKPVIQDWLADNQEQAASSLFGIVQQYVKPLLHLPRQLQDVLNEPKRFRDMEHMKERIRLSEFLHQSKKRDALWFMILSFIGTYLGFLLNHFMLAYGTAAMFAVSTVYYLYVSISYKRFINEINRKDD